MRILFFGSDDLAEEVLSDLIDHEFQIIGVVVQPDSKAGRGRKLKPSPVKIAAQNHRVQIFEPTKASSEVFINQVKQLEADLFVVFSYGQILSQTLLDTVKIAINIHPSMLPSFRGPSPIRAPLMNGYGETGVSIIKMNAEMDAGPLLAQEGLVIERTWDYTYLKKKLCDLSKKLIKEVLRRHTLSQLVEKEQKGDITFSYMHQKTLSILCEQKVLIEKKFLNWKTDVQVILNLVRSLSDKGVDAKIVYKGVEIQVIIYQMQIEENDSLRKGSKCGEVIQANKMGLLIQCDGAVCKIMTLQRPGKRKLSYKDFVNSLSNLSTS